MATPAREAPAPPAVTDDLDDLFAPGTRVAWSTSIVLLIAFLAVLVWGATTDAGDATPRAPNPESTQEKEATAV